MMKDEDAGTVHNALMDTRKHNIMNASGMKTTMTTETDFLAC